jgi:predicted N-formylglutamate amidohydrolase
MIEALSREPGLIVGDNEPYDGALKGDTMHTHCTARGIAHALVEVRQDLVSDAAGVAVWADRLAPIIDALAARDDMHEIRHFGSRAP